MTDEKIFGSEWWSNTGGKGETMNCRASIFPTNKTPSQMKLLMHPGKAQAEHRRRTLRRGNEAQSQTRAFIKKMNFLLLYMDAGSLDNKQEQMKSWPAVRKKWARDWTWKSLIPWCSDMKGRDGCNVSWKKRWEGSPLWQLSTLQENWLSRAETWCVLMGEARRRLWEAPREVSPYREKTHGGLWRRQEGCRNSHAGSIYKRLVSQNHRWQFVTPSNWFRPRYKQ